MRRAPLQFWYGAVAINAVLVAFFILTHHPEKAAPQIVCSMLCSIPIAFDIMSK